MTKNDLKLSLWLLLFGLVLMVESLRMPRSGQEFYGFPGFFPFLLSICLIILSFIMFLTTRKLWKSLKFNFSLPDFSDIEVKRSILVTLYIGIYIFVLSKNVFYPVATSIFLFVAIFTFYKGSIIKILLISVICSYLIYYVSVKIFMIPLP